MCSLHEEQPNARIADVPADDQSRCHDCRRPYTDGGFPDLIIPYASWKEISPTGDDGGLLCPSCICARLHAKGIRCEGAFMSGPIESVSRPTMYALRRVENIELAIDGRDNRWSGVREMVQPSAQQPSRYIGPQNAEPPRQVHYVEDERAPGKMAGHLRKREE
jgi:hypothetical protein